MIGALQGVLRTGGFIAPRTRIGAALLRDDSRPPSPDPRLSEIRRSWVYHSPQTRGHGAFLGQVAWAAAPEGAR